MSKAIKGMRQGISSKAQIEMIGLVIVVILLAIGLLFYFKFGILRGNENVEDPTLEIAYVTNLMGSVFNIEICDNNYNIEEALIQCFEDDLSGSNNIFCNGLGSCEYVRDEIGNIIDKVGLKNYQNYSIWVEKRDNSVGIISGCETGVLSYTTIITPNREYYTAYFRVC